MAEYENNSESYARHRLEDSPLNKLNSRSPGLKPLKIEPVKNLSGNTACYIKDVIAGTVLQVLLENQSTSLSEVCQIIQEEVSKLQNLGIDYLLEQEQEFFKFK